MFSDKTNKYIKILLISAFSIVTSFAKAQDRIIKTGVPFLELSADARAAGLGDVCVASSADAFSQQWNPAKYSFATSERGFSLSYTPYLTNLVHNISLGQVTYFNKLNDRSAFAGSLRYFCLGEIELRETANVDEAPRIVSPNEFAVDGSYSLKLSESFSMAVAGRYIHSSLKVASTNVDESTASSFVVDMAIFYQSEEKVYTAFNGIWRAGFNIQNLGPKISYDNDEFNNNFLPANLKIGTGFDFILDGFNSVAFNLEFNKLLVPSPQNPDLNGDGTVSSQERAQSQRDYRSIDVVWGVFKSFADAPDGFSEELKEITYATGAEYS